MILEATVTIIVTEIAYEDGIMTYGWDYKVVNHKVRLNISDVSELSSARLSSDLARARDLSARLSSARAIFEPARV